LVLSCLIFGVVLLIAFCIIETKVEEPMFRLQLFKIRAFTAGVVSGLLAALSRGGLMFILIIWLQGIWLPLHGYDFARTPLWAGIAILPLTAGFLIAGPISGILSDRYGPRIFASGGMIATAVLFVLMELLPVDFPYWTFALLLFLMGLAMASFGSPNRAGVMNSLPAEHRGVGSGMSTTFINSAQVLSIGIFFSLIIIGLSSSLPQSLYHGLIAHGVSQTAAHRVSSLSPVSTLFAALLGYNPIKELLGPHALAVLPHAQQVTLTGRKFFPSLIASPFESGLHAAFDFAIISSILAAIISWTKSGRSPARAPSLDMTSKVEGADDRIVQDHERDEQTVQEPAGAGAPMKSEAMS
jgi:MFS family permease